MPQFEHLDNWVEMHQAPAVMEDTRSKDQLPWLNLLWKNRTLLWRSGVTGFLIAVIISFVIPVRYTSTVQLMPPDSHSMSGMALAASLFTSGGSGGLPFSAGDLTDSPLGLKSSGARFIGILQSRTVQDDLINRFDLRKVYWCKRYESARIKLKDRSSISEDRKSGIISIVVTDHDRSRARDLAGAYVEELDKLVAQLNTSAAHRERIFLEERLAEVKRDLDDASQELSRFSSRNTTLDLQYEGRTVMESAARVQGQLIAAQTELRGLGTIYTDSNARVRRLKAQVSELERQLKNIAGTSTPTPDSHDTSGRLYPSIRQLPIVGVTYMDLYRRVKVQEAVYEALIQQLEIAKVEEAKEIPTVKVLDPPRLAERKSFPPRIMITLTGMLLGVMLASAYLIFKREWELVEVSSPWKQLTGEMSQSISRSSRHALWPGRRSAHVAPFKDSND